VNVYAVPGVNPVYGQEVPLVLIGPYASGDMTIEYEVAPDDTSQIRSISVSDIKFATNPVTASGTGRGGTYVLENTAMPLVMKLIYYLQDTIIP
jgi:hypothetical protein